MSAKEPIAVDAKPSDGFEPIDSKTFLWEPGRTVRNQVSCLIAWDKANLNHSIVLMNCNWFSSAFTLTIVKPVLFKELCELTENAIKEFLKDNQDLLKNESQEFVKAMTTELYKKLFAYWYHELKEIKLTNEESFKAASDAAKARKNGENI